MELSALKQLTPTSPAFIIEENALAQSLSSLAHLRDQSGCKVLYSIKSLPLTAVLEYVRPLTDGFSVSSLFEAKLAREIARSGKDIHLTTPGLRPDEALELSKLCTHISCNSEHQLRLLSGLNHGNASLGLRINPKLSFTADARHDPCRPHSKLGYDISAVAKSGILAQAKGLHFHTVHRATDYLPLIKTVMKIRLVMGKQLSHLQWLNLGGGYLFDRIDRQDEFIDLIKNMRLNFNIETYIEPGWAIVNYAGSLLTTVIDLFTSGGKTIAILDTSVNHHPQVFEYRKHLDLAEHDPDGKYTVLLAGSTCLAGDLFGEYRFKTPLRIGDKLLFKNVGAYSLVKASRFNGYNLPDVYWANDAGIHPIKRYDYQDYRQQWASDAYATPLTQQSDESN